jgi:ATP-dependent protease ClpP protease subunit
MKLKNNYIFIGAAIVLLFALLTPAFAATSASDSTKDLIVLNEANTVSLRGVVDGSSVAEVIKGIEKLNDQKVPLIGKIRHKLFTPKPIYLVLYTPGGDVGAGLELVEAIKGSVRPVHTITMFAASMGFQIAQQLGTRYILETGTLMSHHAKGSVGGEIGGRGTSQIQSRLGYFERLLTELDLQTVARTGGKQTLASYQEAYDHELWVSGKESVAQGYADEVVTVRCDASLAGYEMHTVDIPTPFGNIAVDYDSAKCPLNSAPKNARPHKQIVNDKLDAALTEFKDTYDNIQNHIIPMTY